MSMITATVSAQRLSRIKFDKLLMSHQDSPLVERARETVEAACFKHIPKIKQQTIEKKYTSRLIINH